MVCHLVIDIYRLKLLLNVVVKLLLIPESRLLAKVIFCMVLFEGISGMVPVRPLPTKCRA